MSSSSILIKIGHWFYVHTRFGRWYFNRSLQQVASSFPLGHSAPVTIDYGFYHVRIVSYSQDNYGFIIWRDSSSKCIIVDPGFFPPFDEIIRSQKLVPDTILITHKHYDHCGGLADIKLLYPESKIYSNRLEKVKLANTFINEAVFTFTACEDDYMDPIFVTAYHTPGHTEGHTVYTINTSLIDSMEQYFPLIVFTGDSIFMGSIGALFECSATTNLLSLKTLIKNLLGLNIAVNDIMIFPGHEYSVSSLQFLLCNCSPKSLYGKSKLNWCLEQRNWRLPTIPMSLFEELTYSPFLRIAIATTSKEQQLHCTITNGNASFRMYLPKLEDLLNEFLLTEKLVKNLRKYNLSDLNEESLREKIFEDLFIDGYKIQMRCEHCSPNNHPSTSKK